MLWKDFHNFKYNEKQEVSRLYRRWATYFFQREIQSPAETLNDGLSALIEKTKKETC